MITCYVRYVLDPFKLEEFETYCKMWLPLLDRFGGTHHGYFLPHEGSSNIAVALFSFSSLSAYKDYRARSAHDPDCQAAMRYYAETRCFLSFEGSFMRPILST
ncbi:MAG: NIPSNAP family protein [Pseudomonadota bacterium]